MASLTNLSEEQKVLLSQFFLLSQDILVNFATKNLKNNRDLYLWLGLISMSKPESDEPYEFLKERIPDFEKKFLHEVKNRLTNLKK